MALYIDLTEAARQTGLAEDAVQPLLPRACDEIDALCYGRIRRIGFDRLTSFQQEQIRKAVCEQLSFLHNYGDLLSSPFSAYSINGVSMQFDGLGVVERGGVKAPAQVLALLRQTGLACTRLDGR